VRGATRDPRPGVAVTDRRERPGPVENRHPIELRLCNDGAERAD